MVRYCIPAPPGPIGPGGCLEMGRNAVVSEQPKSVRPEARNQGRPGGGGKPEGGGKRQDGRRGGQRRTQIEMFFSADKSPAELVDELADRQAMQFLPGQVPSSQLRRFLGAVKDLQRRLLVCERPDYHAQIEPEFKMLRSKAFYASRTGPQRIPEGFSRFIENGIRNVKDAESFNLFVRHFEAVVGFMYGKGRVRYE